MWLGALTVDLDLATLACAFGFRARLEQTGDIEPDVETDAFEIHVANRNREPNPEHEPRSQNLGTQNTSYEENTGR
jgi:hypothetical protein